jgi:hypothetical protein
MPGGVGGGVMDPDMRLVKLANIFAKSFPATTILRI